MFLGVYVFIPHCLGPWNRKANNNNKNKTNQNKNNKQANKTYDYIAYLDICTM